MVIKFNNTGGQELSAPNYPLLAAQAVKAQQFDAALDIYANWFDADPLYFNDVSSRSAARVVHIRNAANLARKALFDKVNQVATASERIETAFRYFFGLESKQFQHSLQQPAFFYIPDLPAKPFYTVNEIPELQPLLAKILEFKTDLLKLASHSYQKYVDTSGPVPNTSDWHDIKQKWLSTHLFRGGVKSDFSDKRLVQCQALFETDIVANCQPHAAEVFVSSLLPEAKIPPHYGISNLKLTVHIALKVNTQCSLSAGDEQLFWSSDLEALVFDDSFLHSAANNSTERRDVLIFDIWHPDLATEERHAIQHFMKQHQVWSKKYAKVAALDARL